jgi:alcohol dehydrogenase
MNFTPSFDPSDLPGSNVKVAFGAGALDRLGNYVQYVGGSRVLLVSDPGITAAGHVERAVRALYKAGVTVRVFDGAGENPTTLHVTKGVIVAKPFNPNLIIGLGGGSAMDCGKGINFLLTNGGTIQDYWGVNKATKPMLPFIAIPTTAGTGSDAQSFALITDPGTHQKMACGDTKALPRLAVLDPQLTATMPPKVAAATGIDAVAHAVETAGSNKRTDVSRELSRQAWDRLSAGFERTMEDPSDLEGRRAMLLGAHLAGAAIENSMLGGAHSCANALTALRGVVHGVAVGLMLPWVVRFNAAANGNPYSDLDDAEHLARKIEHLLDEGKIPRRLSDLGIGRDAIPEMAALAAKQWTATFNPRPVAQAEFERIFESAL